MNSIPASEVAFIRQAARYLENPSFIVRLADVMGMPLEGVFDLVPRRVSEVVTFSLQRAAEVAVSTLPQTAPREATFTALGDRAWWTGYRHTATAAVSGGAGGFFGVLGMCVEVPITTCIMLRSIGAIARDYGEDMRSVEVRLDCLSLFAAGGPSASDDEMDASYLAVRASLSALVKHAASFVAHTPVHDVVASIKNGTAPTLVKLIGKIAQRFEVAVTEKLMAQALPVVGAVGGATVNVLFAEHFNTLARYHFGLRHLERRWGTEAVQARYREAALDYRPQDDRRIGGAVRMSAKPR